MFNSKNARKYLNEDELKDLLAVIRKHGNVRDEAIFTVAYWRGLRASEVGLIPFSAWDRRNHTLFVHRLKGSLDGDYLICKHEHRALSRWALIRGTAAGPLFPSRESGPLGKGISRNMLAYLMNRYATEAGLPAHLRHMHALKHACGTHLIAKGAELYEVKDWLGHKSINSTLIYAQFRNAQRTAAAQKIYAQG